MGQDGEYWMLNCKIHFSYPFVCRLTIVMLDVSVYYACFSYVGFKICELITNDSVINAQPRQLSPCSPINIILLAIRINVNFVQISTSCIIIISLIHIIQ